MHLKFKMIVHFRNYCVHYFIIAIFEERIKMQDKSLHFQGNLHTGIYIRYQNASSYNSDYHPVALFSLIKTPQQFLNLQ